MAAYLFTINLNNQDTTPSFVVYREDINFTFPANSFPRLKNGDVLNFNWNTDWDVPNLSSPVTNLSLYVTALVKHETNAPFAYQDTSLPPPTPGHPFQLYNPDSPNQPYSVVVKNDNGQWSFSLLGMMTVPSQAMDVQYVNVPFYIDPDMDVGSGTPP